MSEFHRTPTTIRLTDAEKKVLRTAARCADTSVSHLLRSAGLAQAAEILEADADHPPPDSIRAAVGEDGAHG